MSAIEVNIRTNEAPQHQLSSSLAIAAAATHSNAIAIATSPAEQRCCDRPANRSPTADAAHAEIGSTKQHVLKCRPTIQSSREKRNSTQLNEATRDVAVHQHTSTSCSVAWQRICASLSRVQSRIGATRTTRDAIRDECVLDPCPRDADNDIRAVIDTRCERLDRLVPLDESRCESINQMSVKFELSLCCCAK